MLSADGLSVNGQRLLAAFKKIRKQGIGMHPHANLRPSEMMMLHYIYRRLKKKTEAADARSGEPAGVTVSELSEFAGQTPSAVSQAVKSLEEKGYASRTFCPSDRRVVLVSISDEGKKLFMEQEKTFSLYLEKITEALGEEDTNRLTELLEKLADVLPTIDRAITEGKE